MHLNTYHYEKLVSQEQDVEQRHDGENSERSEPQEVFRLDPNVPAVDKQSTGRVIAAGTNTANRLGLLKRTNSPSPSSSPAVEAENED